MDKGTIERNKKIRESFIFYYHDKDNNKHAYFCTCGNKIIDNSNQEEMKISKEQFFGAFVDVDNYDHTIADIMDKNKVFDFSCDKCQKDFSKKEVVSTIKELDTNFLEIFDLQENDEDVLLSKTKYKGERIIISQHLVARIMREIDDVSIISEQMIIGINKSTKQCFYKTSPSSHKTYFDLNNIFPILKTFYDPANSSKRIVDNLFNVHLFLNRITDFVSDSKSMDIVNELLSQMIGRDGVDVLLQANSIFFAIICYPSLSTIVLTKGLNFLYDMLNGCTLPSSQYLKDNNVTSPVKIFNFLVTIKNDEIQSELDSENSDKQKNYVFAGKGGKQIEMKKFDITKELDFRAKQVTLKKGNIILHNELNHKTISPYIFNKIKKFSDYQTIIKYTKFIPYDEVIDLAKKYPIKLMLNIFQMLQYRDPGSMNKDRIKQFFDLGMSYAKRHTVIYGEKKKTEKLREADYFEVLFKEKEFEEVFELENPTETESKNIEKIKTEHLTEEEINFDALNYFELDIYDDCVNMMLNLKWDLNKEFFKIKDIDELIDYHNQLTHHYNALSNAEKNQRFVNFANRFNYLEEYKNNKLKIRVIKTPDSLIGHAKRFKNCSASYVEKITNCKYIMCIVEDGNANVNQKEHPEYMLGLRYERNTLEFDAVKAYCNQIANDKFKRNIRQFMEEMDIPYKELHDIRYSSEKKDNKPGDNFMGSGFTDPLPMA